MLFSGFAYACLSAGGKILMTRLSIEEVVFLRSLVGFFFISLYMIATKEKISLRRDLPLVARGIAGFSAFFCLYYAIHHLPMAVANTLAYTMPIFTVVFAYLFLKEKITSKMLFWIFVSLAGIFLITRPDKSFNNTHLSLGPSFVAILAGVLFAVCCVLARASSKKFRSRIVTFYYVGIATIATFPLAFQKFEWPNFSETILLVAISILALLQQVALVSAAKYAPAGIIGMFSLIGLGLSILMGQLFFNESLQSSQWMGIAVLVISILMVIILSNKGQIITQIDATGKSDGRGIVLG